MKHKARMFNAFIKLFYKNFDPTGFPRKTLLQVLFFQKILGINRHVPWPVHWSSRIESPKKIKRGTECPGYMPGCYIDARNGLILGNNVTIGPNVNIISQNHNVYSFNEYITSNPIIIGENSWLGAGCIILPGVKLGAHTIVGAGAVVNKSLPDNNQVVVGNPAIVKKKIDEYQG